MNSCNLYNLVLISLLCMYVPDLTRAIWHTSKKIYFKSKGVKVKSFKVGDVVMLNSGSQSMTVTRINVIGLSVQCEWFNETEKEFYSDDCNQNALTLVDAI